MSGRLNIFQRTMLQWDELHPYNAVHGVFVGVALDAARIHGSVEGVLQARGLTGLELDAARGNFHYHGGAAMAEVQVLADGADPRATLATEIERQINTPFLREERISPFRFFAVPAEGGFWLGLSYFHAVADAEAIVRLLQDVVASYETGTPTAGGTIDLYPRARASLWRHHPGVLAAKLAAMPGSWSAMRTSGRPSYGDPANGSVGFKWQVLSSPQLQIITAAAKACDVTINDLFLALLLKSIAPLAARRAGSRRPNLSVGSIVNVRREVGLETAGAFGLFLGSFVVTHAVPESMGVMDLAREVRKQTDRIKRRKLFLAAPLELAMARAALSFCSTQRRQKFYQKNYPLWGGITNMNLNRLWKSPVDYVRGVSTGPATPLVLSVTTAGDQVNLGISWRRTVYSETAVAEFTGRLLTAVNRLESGA